MDGGLEMDSEIEMAKKELETWKMKTMRADDTKSRLILEKLEEDEAKEKAKAEMLAWIKKQEECEKEFNQHMSAVKAEILKLSQHKQDLVDKLNKRQAELVKKREESSKLKQKFKFCVQIPDTEVRFTRAEEDSEDSQPIRGVFVMSERVHTVPLQAGQALITFEEEGVAPQILQLASCSVPCENVRLHVKPKAITLDPAVKFEVHLEVSRKTVKVFNIPPLLPEERMKDRLEISFSRPSRGGGEVEGVEYHKNAGTALVTFLHTGVAEVLAQKRSYQVELDSEMNVQVGPVYKHQLRRFQTFCVSPKRTILLDDIKNIMDDGDIQDNLEIHFQRTSNGGGEIESIVYKSGGNPLQAVFCEDAEK